MPRQVNNQPVAPPPAVPGVDIDQVPSEAPVQAAPQEEPAKQGRNGEYVYRPSEKTLAKLDSFKFWPEVKRDFGIDIEFLKANVKTYGILEALAYGSWTPTPITLKIRGVQWRPNDGKDKFLVRLFPTKDSWNIQTYPVTMKYKLDEKGNVVLGADGKPRKEFVHRKLQEGEIIQFNGRDLSKEDMDHLRYTGTIGHSLLHVSSDGREFNWIVTTHPFDEGCLCCMTTDSIKSMLAKHKEVCAYKEKEKDKVSGQEKTYTYELSPKAVSEIANGGIVEASAKEDPSKRAFLMFDCSTARVRKTVSYEYALKNALKSKETEQFATQPSKEQGAAQSKSKGV